MAGGGKQSEPFGIPSNLAFLIFAQGSSWPVGRRACNWSMVTAPYLKPSRHFIRIP